MKMLATTRLPFALMTVLIFALPIGAQDQPRSYVPFEIDPDYQKILRDRLAMEGQLGPFKDLVKQILADPTKIPIDPAKVKDMKLEDPKFKQALQDWLESDPKLRQTLSDWIADNPPGKQPADMKKLQREMKQLLDAPPKPKDDAGIEPGEAPANKAEPVASRQDPLAKLTEQAMKQTQQTKLGEWLRDSPAWRQAIADLHGGLNEKEGGRWNPDGWQARLLTPDGQTWKLAEGTLERLRNLPRPNFDRFQWDLAAPGTGKPPLPEAGAAGRGGPSLPSFSTGATWLLLALLGALIGWRVLRWVQPAPPAPSVRPNRGPWPVRPEAVATRRQLVHAFDYLALWTLGLAVQSWNHQAVAARWREQSSACAESAAALAKLYEQARYTDGIEALSDTQRDLACRALLQIAEAL